MREIKIKYYYTNGKEIFSKVFDMDSEIANGNHWDEISDSPILKNYSILDRVQSTGLKDKNWKEIYEGDIVGLEKWWNIRWYIKYWTLTAWDDYGENIIWNWFWLYRIWDDKWNEELEDSSDYIIIWNIYENSNLLNKD